MCGRSFAPAHLVFSRLSCGVSIARTRTSRSQPPAFGSSPFDRSQSLACPSCTRALPCELFSFASSKTWATSSLAATCVQHQAVHPVPNCRDKTSLFPKRSEPYRQMLERCFGHLSAALRSPYGSPDCVSHWLCRRNDRKPLVPQESVPLSPEPKIGLLCSMDEMLPIPRRRLSNENL